MSFSYPTCRSVLSSPSAFFNDITYVHPKVPTLFTVMTTGDNATNPDIYGVNSHAYVLEKNQYVDIVVNNLDTGKHPFHLHGHNFQVIARSDDNGGSYSNNVTFPKIPMRRDTILVRPLGYIVLRFKADNPGVWLFHCHIEWYAQSISLAQLHIANSSLQAHGFRSRHHHD
jgi:iron transport multicopper oxidase